MTAAQCVDSTYQIALRQKYGRWLTELHLAHCRDKRVLGLLAFLATFDVSLDHITIPSVIRWHEALLAHPKDLDASFARQDQVDEIVGRVVRRAASVTISDPFEHVGVGTIQLCVGPAIRRLALVATDYQLRNVFDALRACPNLRHLELLPVPTRGEVLSDVKIAEITAGPLPALTSLSISCPFLASVVEVLLDALARTLKTLAIEFTDRGPRKQYILLATRFPALRTLTIRGHQPSGGVVISSVAPHRYPKLRNLVWQPTWMVEANHVSTVVALLQNVIDNYCDADLDETVDFELRCSFRIFADCHSMASRLRSPASLRLRIRLAHEDGPVPHDFLRWPDAILHDSQPLADAQQAVYDSLDALRDLTNFAVATGDRVQLAEIGQALQEGEWLRYNARM